METTQIGTGDTRLCRICNDVKPVTEFHRLKKYLRWECKECGKKRVRQWCSQNRDTVSEYNKKFRIKHHVRIIKQEKEKRDSTPKPIRSLSYWARELKRHYGVTADWYKEKLAEQGGGCALCGVKTSNGRRLGVDHCHVANRNRGILCHGCNAALERLETVPDWATLAKIYLDTYEQHYWTTMESKYSKL